MGMYDSIICKYPLPQPEDPKGYTASPLFQTKCFDCSLSTYEIGLNGQLYILQSEGYYKEEKTATSFLDLGEYIVTKRWVEALTNTCEITIYDYIHSKDTDFDYYIEYDISFHEGILDEVKLVKFDAWPNAERKQRDEEWKIKLKKRHDFMQTRRYKYLYSPYNKVLRYSTGRISECLTSLNGAINRLSSKLSI